MTKTYVILSRILFEYGAKFQLEFDSNNYRWVATLTSIYGITRGFSEGNETSTVAIEHCVGEFIDGPFGPENRKKLWDD